MRSLLAACGTAVCSCACCLLLLCWCLFVAMRCAAAKQLAAHGFLAARHCSRILALTSRSISTACEFRWGLVVEKRRQTWPRWFKPPYFLALLSSAMPRPESGQLASQDLRYGEHTWGCACSRQAVQPSRRCARKRHGSRTWLSAALGAALIGLCSEPYWRK